MDRWRFLHITDTHVGSPRSFRYQPKFLDQWETAKAQIQELEPDLVLVGGDITRDGFVHDFEFENSRDYLKSLGIPWHVVPGNMDVGNKFTERQGNSGKPTRMSDPKMAMSPENLARWRSYFGPLQWTFLHKDVRFTGFCASVTDSGFAEEAELWNFLEGLGDLPPARHHVVMTHFPLFVEDPLESTADFTADPYSYQTWYFQINYAPRMRIYELLEKAGVQTLLSGHIHNRRVDRFREMTFYKGPTTAFSQFEHRWPDGDPTLGFQLFEVSDSGLEYRFIPLRELSDREGYGPGGHPREELRDYSIAWEK